MSWLTVGLYRKSDYSPSNLHLTVYLNQRSTVPRTRRTRIRTVLTISSRESCYFFSHESVSRLTVRRSASSIRENISSAGKTARKRIRYPCNFDHLSDRFFLFSSHELTRTRIFVTHYTRERERIFPRSRNNLTDVFPKYGKTGDTRRGGNRAKLAELPSDASIELSGHLRRTLRKRVNDC